MCGALSLLLFPLSELGQRFFPLPFDRLRPRAGIGAGACVEQGTGTFSCISSSSLYRRVPEYRSVGGGCAGLKTRALRLNGWEPLRWSSHCGLLRWVGSWIIVQKVFPRGARLPHPCSLLRQHFVYGASLSQYPRDKRCGRLREMVPPHAACVSPYGPMDTVSRRQKLHH